MFYPVAELICRKEQHYWKLWGLDSDESAGQGMSALQADSEFQGEEITVNAEDIQQFCKGQLYSHL